MGKIKLEALKLEVPGRRFYNYVDHGFVNNIPEGYIKIWDKALNGYLFEEVYDDAEKYFYERTCGLTLVTPGFFPFSKKTVHILYIDLENEMDNLFVRAHEETHAIKRLRRLDQLQEEFRKVFVLPGEFNRLEEELIADMGGVVGVLRNGYSLEDIFGYYGKSLNPDSTVKLRQYLKILKV